MAPPGLPVGRPKKRSPASSATSARARPASNESARLRASSRPHSAAIPCSLPVTGSVSASSKSQHHQTAHGRRDQLQQDREADGTAASRGSPQQLPDAGSEAPAGSAIDAGSPQQPVL